MEAQLRLQDQVAGRLRESTPPRGAEPGNPPGATGVRRGTLTDLAVEHPNRARALIEDFMIATNGVTARYLAARASPSLPRRVLRSPERWARIVELAAGLGASLPPEPDAAALDAFLTVRRQADPLRFPDLSLAIVKLMGRGEYVVELPARRPRALRLAIEAYTHSTAPNRRFPDVIAQRLVKAALARPPGPYTTADSRTLPSTAPRRRTARTRSSGRWGNRPPRSCWSLGSASSSTRSSRGRRRRGPGSASCGRRWKASWCMAPTGWTSATVQVTLIATDVEQGYIDFSRVGGSPAMGLRSRATR